MNIICSMTKSFHTGTFNKSIGKATLWSTGYGRHFVHNTKFLLSSVLCKKNVPPGTVVKLFHQYCLQTRNSNVYKKINIKPLRRCSSTNVAQTVGRVISKDVKLPLQRKTAVQEMKRIIGLAKPEQWKLTGASNSQLFSLLFVLEIHHVVF